ncbi:hypothetical protein Tco_0596270 [Tanacetum coccineum]
MSRYSHKEGSKMGYQKESRIGSSSFGNSSFGSINFNKGKGSRIDGLEHNASGTNSGRYFSIQVKRFECYWRTVRPNGVEVIQLDGA